MVMSQGAANTAREADTSILTLNSGMALVASPKGLVMLPAIATMRLRAAIRGSRRSAAAIVVNGPMATMVSGSGELITAATSAPAPSACTVPGYEERS
jgi:hypothetical protein